MLNVEVKATGAYHYPFYTIEWAVQITFLDWGTKRPAETWLSKASSAFSKLIYLQRFANIAF